MKKLVLLVFFSFPFLFVHAQKYGIIEEKQVQLHDKVKPAFSTVLETDEKFLKKEWSSYLKASGVSLRKSKGVLSADDAVIKAITAYPVSIYTIIGTTNGIVSFDVFIALEGEEFISSLTHKTEAAKAREYMKKFVDEHIVKSYTASLEEERDVSSSLEKKNSKLIKEKSKILSRKAKYEKQIEKSEKKIVKNDQKIRDMELQIEKMKSEIHKLKEKISESTKDLNNIEREIKESEKSLNLQKGNVDKAKEKLDKNQ